MIQLPTIRKRDDGLARTSITNELTDALLGLVPTLRTGQVEEPLLASASLMLWAKLTSATLIDEANPHKWRYSWVEQALERNNAWSDLAGGRSSAASGEFAYNTIEANNSETGIQGNGINMDDLPSGYELIPASAGTPLVALFPKINCDGVTEWYFWFENVVSGDCPPP